MRHGTIGLLVAFILAFGFVCVSIVLAALRQSAASERLARGAGVELESRQTASVVNTSGTPRTVSDDARGITARDGLHARPRPKSPRLRG